MRRDIIVLGGSAGAVEALREILARIRPTIEAALFVVCHTAPAGTGRLHEVLRGSTSLPVDFATEGAPIVSGRIFVAPPDRHLILEPNGMRVLMGPKHNRTRPAIDPLFRSAAEAFGPRVVGVLLTGLMDDGVAGLSAIKQARGITVVQDPANAQFPTMPQNALAAVPVDFVARLDEIPTVLGRLAAETANVERAALPRKVQGEVEADAGKLTDMDGIGKPSMYSCPDCGGVLWEVDDPSLPRFRCHVGHSFSMEGLQQNTGERAEEALWAALRALRENIGASRKLLAAYKARNITFAMRELEEKIMRNEQHAGEIERLLTSFT